MEWALQLKAISVNYCFGGGSTDDRSEHQLYNGVSQSTNVFPNPVNGQLHLLGTTEFDTVLLTDFQSRKLIAQQGKPDLTLDMNQLENGIYFLTVLTTNNSQHHKIA